MKVTSQPSRPSELSPAKRALVKKRLRGEGSGHTASSLKIAIPHLAASGPTPLSFAQRRLWFSQQMTPASPLYNISQSLRLEGPMDVDALTKALSAVVERQDRIIKLDYGQVILDQKSMRVPAEPVLQL